MCGTSCCKILDDGRITDSQGRTVDFKNTVIVMTSNIGARNLTAMGGKLGFSAEERGSDPDAEKKFENAKGAGHGGAAPDLPAGVPEPDRRHHRLPSPHRGGHPGGGPPDAADRLRPDGDHGHPPGTPATRRWRSWPRRASTPATAPVPLRRAIQSKVEDAVAEKMLDGTLKAGDTARLTVEGRPPLRHKVNIGPETGPEGTASGPCCVTRVRPHRGGRSRRGTAA